MLNGLFWGEYPDKSVIHGNKAKHVSTSGISSGTVSGKVLGVGCQRCKQAEGWWLISAVVVLTFGGCRRGVDFDFDFHIIK